MTRGKRGPGPRVKVKALYRYVNSTDISLFIDAIGANYTRFMISDPMGFIIIPNRDLTKLIETLQTQVPNDTGQTDDQKR